MKRQFLFGLFATAMLFATSCQKDELSVVQSGDESVVTFTFEQPGGIATRATYSDGTKATTLTYAAYERESGKIIAQKEVAGAFVGKEATVTLNLKKGVTYDVVFWADSESAPYTFNAANKTISVDYTSVVCSDDKLDAFFAAKEVRITDESSTTVPVELTRPFAQLNIGATSISRDELPAQTSVTVPVYSTLNLLTGDVVGEASAQTFQMNDIPTANDYFPLAGVHYLAMNYLLVNEQVNVDVTFKTSDSYETNFNNIPVKRNYRTNIHGNILKSYVDFTLTIDEGIEYWPDTPSTGLEFVDLGTGVEWATMNVGSAMVTELGGYFAWGETTSVNFSYGWNYYDFYTGDPYHEGDKTEFMSEYNANDGLTVLGTEHDAAYVNWNKIARIPTKEEFDALVEQCEWEWDAVNFGYIVKGNGNQIFLPGSPYKYNRYTYGNPSNKDINYWTSTLGENKTCAYLLTGDASTAPTVTETTDIPRMCGLQIRPVKVN